MRPQLAAAIKSVAFVVVVPLSVAVLVPVWWLRPRGAALWPVIGWHWTGALFVAAGALLLLVSTWQFAWKGLGTPAPIDPPKHFVATGPFRYVRNPMYVGVFTVIVGEAVLFVSMWRWLLGYAAVFWVAVTLFVMLYEEPNLRKRFGAEYEDYCRRVNRWLPKPPKEDR